MKTIYLYVILGMFNVMAPVYSKKKAPFTIPPTGQPEKLVSEMDLVAPTAMAFDSKNRPYIMNTRTAETFGKLYTIREGKWISTSFLSLIDEKIIPTEKKVTNLQAKGEMVIDDSDCLYATVKNHLIYSPDLGKSFKVYPCKGSLELRTSQRKFEYPPAICKLTDMRYVDRGEKRTPKMAWWAKRGKLSVYLPVKTDDGLDLGEPILITENCMAAGSGGHSGGTSFAVTIGNLTHIVYAECPEDARAGGNPIYAATLDRNTRKIIEKKFLVNAPPKKTDVHTRPTITADSKGYLHVLSGSHGEPFYYLSSLKPEDISEWSKPVKLTGRQCYASIVCDKNDKLHSVFREWIPHASLGYSTGKAKEGTWAKPQTLVHGANKKGKYEYGIFYHRLFIDRKSNLYISFTFFEFKSDIKGVYPEVLIISTDGGKTWRITKTDMLKSDRKTL